MNKRQKLMSNKPAEAIVTPVSHHPKSRVTDPGVANVRRAKEYVDENKK
ncbi:MAG: DUF3787 domain-containing protein [Clostridia bacterium]|nr:DUF3787 domain-containing protein [Clostridia bacterium]